ncbi:MAG: hypothetical protein ACMXYF_01270 [Candidatus Woesearchaeota archaeon]
MTLKKIINKAGLNCRNISKFGLDVLLASSMLASPNQDLSRGNYNVHTLNNGRAGQIAVDAKYLNKENGQSGRGSLRLIFDRKTGDFVEIAREGSNGNYDTLVRVKADQIKEELDIMRANDLGYTTATVKQAQQELGRIGILEANIANGFYVSAADRERMQRTKARCQEYLNTFTE